MSTNRLFTLIVVAALIVVVALVAPGMFASAGRSSQADEIIKLDSLSNHADALQDVVSAQSAPYDTRKLDILENRAALQAADKVAHEYRLTEWYGDVPQSTAEQAAHEYRMTEWYGQTP
jgi:hypothetical protein